MSYQRRQKDKQKVRNLVAKNDFNKGSGRHGKTFKARRRANEMDLENYNGQDDEYLDDLAWQYHK